MHTHNPPPPGRPLWFTLRAAFMSPRGVTLDLTWPCFLTSREEEGVRRSHNFYSFIKKVLYPLYRSSSRAYTSQFRSEYSSGAARNGWFVRSRDHYRPKRPAASRQTRAFALRSNPGCKIMFNMGPTEGGGGQAKGPGFGSKRRHPALPTRQLLTDDSTPGQRRTSHTQSKKQERAKGRSCL